MRNNKRNKQGEAYLKVSLTFLLVILLSPFLVAEDVPINQDAFQSEAEEQKISPEEIFKQNPTPENFDQLPNPTAADLEKVFSPTLDNFRRLNPQEKGKYLETEKKGVYRQDFANEFYSNAENWAVSEKANKVFFSESHLRDFLREGLTFGDAGKIEAAQKYFAKFAPLYFHSIGDDFKYDAQSNLLTNNLATISIQDLSDDKSIEAITSTEKGFSVRQKRLDKSSTLSIEGDAQKKISYDKEKRNFRFDIQTASGLQIQEFSFSAEESNDVSFSFDKDKVTINGKASGIIPLKGGIVSYRNYQGFLQISYDGETITAQNAEVTTPRFYADGFFTKAGNLVRAWDAGGKQSVIIDKNSCTISASTCLGVLTQGQRNPSDYERSQGITESTLIVHLDTLAPQSPFNPDPAQKAALEKQKGSKESTPQDRQTVLDFFRQQAEELRKPCAQRDGCIPLQANNAEVYFHNDHDKGLITVSSRGKAQVGLFDLSGNVHIPGDRFNYVGISGNSELQMQFQDGQKGVNNYNILGLGKLTAEKQTILNSQEGASVKLLTNLGSSGNKDNIIRGDCFSCAPGEAFTITKEVAIASTVSGNVVTGAEFSSLHFTARMGEDGNLEFQPSRQDLGILAAGNTGSLLSNDPRKQVVLGNNLIIAISCGGQNCGFQLAKDGQGNLGANYFKVNPQDPTQVTKVPYSLEVKKALGEVLLISSAQNAENYRKLNQALLAARSTGSVALTAVLSSLDFDSSVPGYETLRKWLMQQQMGVDISRLADKSYQQVISKILDNYAKAFSQFTALGIQLDENGRGLTEIDRQKISETLRKMGGSDFDKLTAAQLLLAQNKVTEISEELKSCAGTTYCSYTSKELQEAKGESARVQNLRQVAYQRYLAAVEQQRREKLRRRD